MLGRKGSVTPAYYDHLMHTHKGSSFLPVVALLLGCGPQQASTTKVQVGGIEYRFQREYLRASLPDATTGWVIVKFGPPDRNSFVLEYAGDDQSPAWPSGVPNIRWITQRNTRPSELLVTAIGAE